MHKLRYIIYIIFVFLFNLIQGLVCMTIKVWYVAGQKYSDRKKIIVNTWEINYPLIIAKIVRGLERSVRNDPGTSYQILPRIERKIAKKYSHEIGYSSRLGKNMTKWTVSTNTSGSERKVLNLIRTNPR